VNPNDDRMPRKRFFKRRKGLQLGIYSQFLILFALIGTGYICKKNRLISNNMNEDLGNLVLFVSMPALIVHSMSTFKFSKEMMYDIVSMLGISIGLYIFYILMSIIVPRVLGLQDKERDIVEFATIFANTGFMGFPICYIFFGSEGLLYIVIINMFYDVFAWTYGVSILGRHSLRDSQRDRRFSLAHMKGIVNPNIIAVLLGFALIVTAAKMPGPVLGYLDMLGKIATPLAMIFVGSMLADLKFAHIFTNKIIVAESLIKLVALPLMVFGLCWAIGLSGMLLSIPVLATAMPAAASTPILAEKYGNDRYFASKIVFVNTLLSIVTIPLIVSILSL